jgi:LysR family cys regulon transcriptional activator
MRLEQLRFLCEIVDQGFNISRAAEALHTSQPGVSKQIRLLERELDVEVLRRRKGRVVGVTEPGAAVLRVARNMLRDANTIVRIRDEFSRCDSGRLAIATTHLHACYVLPKAIERFRRRYPGIQWSLMQANPGQIVELVSSGKADIGITGEAPGSAGELVELPSYELARSLIVPARHPLLRSRRLSLEEIARHPLIAHDVAYPGGVALRRAFSGKNIEPTIVIRATDSEVIKAYVKLGLGIAVLPTITFDPRKDGGLRAIEATHLFGPAAAATIVRPDLYLRGYMYDFIQMVAPEWTRPKIARVLTQSSARGGKAATSGEFRAAD